MPAHSSPKFRKVAKAAFACIGLLVTLAGISVRAQSAPVKNIVLVHGAWADGSGWKGVYDILVKDNFMVSIVQEPETSFQQDVAATKRVLALQEGPLHPCRSQLRRRRNHRRWN